MGLAWETKIELTAPNGAPNAVTPDPLADTVGFDCSGFQWGVFSVRCETGEACTYRLHFRWDGLLTADDAWDEVAASDGAVAAGRSATQRIRCAGAKRVYIELLTLTGGTVTVLWANATGTQP